jgi:hypothetical protein
MGPAIGLLAHLSRGAGELDSQVAAAAVAVDPDKPAARVVGKRVREDADEEGTPFWGSQWWETHRGMRSTMMRTGGRASPVASRRGGGGHWLRGREASWHQGGSCGGDRRVGGGQRWLAVGEALMVEEAPHGEASS